MDEIEKAHPRLFDLFLQVFDEGRITDAKGRTVDAKNAIFIMTSNLQNEYYQEEIGFHGNKGESIETLVHSEVSKIFRTEFINRIDDQIVFRVLNESDVGKILTTILDKISEDVKERYNVTLKITEDAMKFITQRGYSPQYGVRELRRTVERYIQIPLSNLILCGKLKEYNSWQVVFDNGEISIVPL